MSDVCWDLQEEANADMRCVIAGYRLIWGQFLGVDYIELTSPAASEASYEDCKAICQLGLKAKILTHVRCHMDDAKLAVETGYEPVWTRVRSVPS